MKPTHMYLKRVSCSKCYETDEGEMKPTCPKLVGIFC